MKVQRRDAFELGNEKHKIVWSKCVVLEEKWLDEVTRSEIESKYQKQVKKARQQESCIELKVQLEPIRSELELDSPVRRSEPEAKRKRMTA